MMTSVEQGYPVTTQGAKPHRSTVYIGLTRQKTNAAEARVADILLPTDDRNWELRYDELYRRFNQSRAIAIDMESATIAANGFRLRVPYDVRQRLLRDSKQWRAELGRN